MLLALSLYTKQIIGIISAHTIDSEEELLHVEMLIMTQSDLFCYEWLQFVTFSC